MGNLTPTLGDPNLQQKLEKLKTFFNGKKAIVAFSGGVDSSLLAFLAKNCADDVLLLTEKSILYPEGEMVSCRLFAEKYGISHEFIERDPFIDERFVQNPPDRCYFCKKGLYDEINRIKLERGFDIVVDGSNMDDLKDYRPGIRATKELNIQTPYIDFDLHKDEIRKLSEVFHLPTHKKPSMACLSSRVSYYQRITPDTIVRIQKAENFLRNLLNLQQIRVRTHPDNIARIEILPNDLQKVCNKEIMIQIAKEFKQYGFCYVTLDLEGFRSGSMNEILKTGHGDSCNRC